MKTFRLQKVELIKTDLSGTGYAALLGTGNTWGDVLRVKALNFLVTEGRSLQKDLSK